MIRGVPATIATLTLLATSLFAAPSGASLVAAAGASGRPPECAVSSRKVVRRRASIWQRARVPQLERYCDLLSQAHAQLGSEPAKSEKLASEADKLLPDRAAPSAILGRAAAALGKGSEALARFERAKKLDARSLEDPLAMHDFARTLMAADRLNDALALYRRLVPRVGLLPSTERGTRVLLEAGHASMRAGAPENAGGSAVSESGTSAVAAKPGLDEAVAYLREAKQRPPSALSSDVTLSLALALDRGGDVAQADAALAELASGTRGKGGGGFDFAGSPAERAALEALALEKNDREAAAKAWEAYLAGPGAKHYAAAARLRLEALRKGGKPRMPGAARGPAATPAPTRSPRLPR